MSETDFIAYLKTLKPEDWDKKVTDQWAVKDVVAHMVGWEKEAARIIKSIWEKKKIPWFYKTDDYDNFNKKAVEYYKEYKPNELIEEWEKWQSKVDKEISRIGEDKLRARPDLFGWLFEEGSNSHANEHYQQIKNVIENNV